MSPPNDERNVSKNQKWGGLWPQFTIFYGKYADKPWIWVNLPDMQRLETYTTVFCWSQQTPGHGDHQTMGRFKTASARMVLHQQKLAFNQETSTLKNIGLTAPNKNGYTRWGFKQPKCGKYQQNMQLSAFQMTVRELPT